MLSCKVVAVRDNLLVITTHCSSRVKLGEDLDKELECEAVETDHVVTTTDNDMDGRILG